MIVVDTSTWIDQFRGRATALDSLLGRGLLLLHPFVRGELLLNGLPRQGPAADLLDQLPPAPLASTAEVTAFIVWGRLAGTGIGYVDTHILLSTKLAEDGRLLTQDRKLHAQAVRLGIAFTS